MGSAGDVVTGSTKSTQSDAASPSGREAFTTNVVVSGGTLAAMTVYAPVRGLNHDTRCAVRHSATIYRLGY